MMTTLVYYEFMLLQLDAKSNKNDLPALCVWNGTKKKIVLKLQKKRLCSGQRRK